MTKQKAVDGGLDFPLYRTDLPYAKMHIAENMYLLDVSHSFVLVSIYRNQSVEIEFCQISPKSLIIQIYYIVRE